MIQKETNHDEGKIAAAKAAITFVQSGMTLGLGTGSTVNYFIQFLKQSGLKVRAVATSLKTEVLAKAAGIPLLDPETIQEVDLAVDGADEIDPLGRMIKGGGGALLREKICATMARSLTVIVDESKCVKCLGTHPLPLEILPWGKLSTERELKSLGFSGKWRENTLSDNGNALFDIHFKEPLTNPEEINARLLNIPGIVATGFFFNLASRVIVGYRDGKVEIR